MGQFGRCIDSPRAIGRALPRRLLLHRIRRSDSRSLTREGQLLAALDFCCRVQQSQLLRLFRHVEQYGASMSHPAHGSSGGSAASSACSIAA